MTPTPDPEGRDPLEAARRKRADALARAGRKAVMPAPPTEEDTPEDEPSILAVLPALVTK